MPIKIIPRDPVLRAITRKIVQHYHPEKIILFGSRAWGRPHKDSDYDLLIVKKNPPRKDRSEPIHELFFPRDFSMDVMVLSPQEVKRSLDDEYNYFIRKIFKTGKTLYGRKKLLNGVA
jgi:predicted nucleotidyltransferase